jgi:hypothetical protein
MAIQTNAAVWGEWQNWTKFDIDRLFRAWLAVDGDGARASEMFELWDEESEWFRNGITANKLRSLLSKCNPQVPIEAVRIFMNDQLRAAELYLRAAIAAKADADSR